ncbi:hypothetical protein C8R45DRAFT_1096670 [Mycena sanguinolenta]|nr:hypothetical protein C8R45DRAFT_1096670 [Mycena sanguinolenta]
MRYSSTPYSSRSLVQMISIEDTGFTSRATQGGSALPPSTAFQLSRCLFLLHPSPPPHLSLLFLLRYTSLLTTLLTALVVVLQGPFAPFIFTTRPNPSYYTCATSASPLCRCCVDVRDSPHFACRLTSSTSSRRLGNPVDQQMALLALYHANAEDGPGELYVQGRRSPNGQLEFKVGETSSMLRRYGEYSKCTKNRHTLEWEFHCYVPYHKLAERLIHLSFRALGGVLTAVGSLRWLMVTCGVARLRDDLATAITPCHTVATN